ncbi:MAG TPA: hypothetical protein VN843_27000 [Anaerolineales bacterium]|nr:hypothetical protein [Anaerolineales bacterium]
MRRENHSERDQIAGLFRIYYADFKLGRNHNVSAREILDTYQHTFDYADVVLRSLIERFGAGARRTSEFVFTSLKTGGRLRDVKKAFDTARLEAGIPDFQLRDLRHSLRHAFVR